MWGSLIRAHIKATLESCLSKRFTGKKKHRRDIKGMIPGIVYENICSVYLHHSCHIWLQMNIENMFGAPVSMNETVMNPDGR